jgi:hypothetical protein
MKKAFKKSMACKKEDLPLPFGPMRTFTGSKANFGTSLRFLKLEIAIVLITRKSFQNR